MSNFNASIELPVYAVRIREYARRDINAEIVRLAELSSEDTALAWRQELKEAIGSLATMPRRCLRVPERFHLECDKCCISVPAVVSSIAFFSALRARRKTLLNRRLSGFTMCVMARRVP